MAQNYNETNSQTNIQSNQQHQQPQLFDSASSDKEASTRSNVLDFPIKKLEDDLIGFNDLQDGLVKYINNAPMPFTMAVQGEWGIGKTSFLELLKTRLCEGDGALYYSVWIDASEFTLLQSSTSAVINMLQSMVYQIGHLNPAADAEQKGNEYIEKTTTVLKNLGKFAAKKLITSGAKLATAGVVSEDMVDEISDIISNSWSSSNEVKPDNNHYNNHYNNLSVIKQLQNDITDLIDSTLDINNQAKRGILLFIDNLDRTDPTLTVEILEITKDIFNFGRCIFIIAIESNIAIRGLQSKLGELTPDNEHIFHAYLDKFIQQTITIPHQSTAVTNLMLQLLAEEHCFSEGELNNEDIKSYLKLIALNSIACNPRKIKCFVKNFSLALCVKETRNYNFDKKTNTVISELIFAFMCIQEAFPNLFQKMLDEPRFTLNGAILSLDNKNQLSTALIDWQISLIELSNTDNIILKHSIDSLLFILSMMNLITKDYQDQNLLNIAMDLAGCCYTKPLFQN